MNDFENELKRQPLRAVPRAWRQQILEAAQPEPRARWSGTELLWPSPKAWGGLAAAWLLMICFHVAVRENGDAGASAQTADQIRMAAEERRHLQAEMEEASLHTEAEGEKPRSETAENVKSA